MIRSDDSDYQADSDRKLRREVKDVKVG